MRKLILSIMIIIIFSGISCKKEIQETSGRQEDLPVKEKPRYKFGFIAGMGGMGDKSYNDIIYRGLIVSKKRFNIDISYKAPDKPEEYAILMNELIDDGCNVIIAGGGWYSIEPVDILSQKYPDALFVLIDDYAQKYRENVCSLTFRQNEGSFLAGMLASHMSRTKKIALIAATDADVINDFILGYKAGAEYADQKTEVIVRYIDALTDVPDPFQHPEAAFSISEKLILDNNADVLFQVAGGSGIGVFNAAKQHGKYAIGVDLDQDYLAQGVILASMMKNIDIAVEMIIEKILKGEFKNRPYIMGLKENGVSLSPMTYTRDIIPENVLESIRTAREKIVSGELEIPSAFN